MDALTTVRTRARTGAWIGARMLVSLLLATTAFAACQRSCTFSPVDASPTEGIVVSVSATGLTDVQAFTLRQTDGTQVVFEVGQLDDATVFPAGHLKEHQASGSPVRVWFRTQGSTLIAYHLEDAAGPAPAGSPVSFACG